MPGPHRRLRTIDIAGGGVPKTSQNSQGKRDGKRNGHRPPDDGLGNHRLPLSDASGQTVDIVGGMGT